MRPDAQPTARRRLGGAALAAAPVVLLSSPAAAATGAATTAAGAPGAVRVTAVTGSCAVLVAATAAGDGSRTADVTVSAVATGAHVPAVASLPASSSPGSSSPASSAPTATSAAPGDAASTSTPASDAAGDGTAGLGAVLALDGDSAREVRIDAATLQHDEPALRVLVVLDGAPQPPVDLVLPGCTGVTPTPTPSPSAAPSTGQPSDTPDPSSTSSSSPARDGSPSPSPGGVPSPEASASSSPPTAASPRPVPAGPAARPQPHGRTSGTDDGGHAGGYGVTPRLGVSVAPVTALPVTSATTAVPAPVIAPPAGDEGGAPGPAVAAPPFAALLPSLPERGQEQRDVSTLTFSAGPGPAGAAHPLADLAPAALALFATLSGLLAGRRRAR